MIDVVDPTATTLETAAVAGAALSALSMTYSCFSHAGARGSLALQRYVATLRGAARALFLRIDVRPIVVGQALAAYLLVAIALDVHDTAPLVGVPIVAYLPRWIFALLKRRRAAAIEAQTDSFVVALTSALKATPSIGDAFQSLAKILGEPLRSEIELATKQIRLGATLEEGLLAMARRIESRAFDTAIAAVLIGQRLGGDLPAALASTGAAIRELHRLDRMSRAKTASGRVQLSVIAFAPVVLALAMNAITPGYFQPLSTTPWGTVAVVVAVALWVAALLLGRRILAVTT